MTTVVCIDGPNGVGKTALARGLAGELRTRWLSVGAVYRALAAAHATLDTELRLAARPAADGVLDPLIRVGSTTFTEPDLVGTDRGRGAEAIAHLPQWQHKVNTELRRYAEGGLVVEGRATQVVFPDAALHVYVWADAVERARRAAAVTGAPPDLARDRRDAGRAAEPLRVRPGVVVWNSTRYSLEQTVAGLLRRVRLATGTEPAVVGIDGDPPHGVEAEVRLVNAATAEGPVDAVLRVPPGACTAELVAAHLGVLLAGNDVISVGAVGGGADPSPSQRVLEAAPWPLQRWLRAEWLLQHGHFAVSGDVLGLAAEPVAGRLAAGAAVPRTVLDALQGARWVPNPGAAVRSPAGRGAPLSRKGLAELLDGLAAHRSGDEPHPVDLRDHTDARAALWVLAAAPHQVLDVTLAWGRSRAGANP
jgi:cytidylate kinase